MKHISAIAQPHRLGSVERALHAVGHRPGFSIDALPGHARGRGDHRPSMSDEWRPDAHTGARGDAAAA